MAKLRTYLTANIEGWQHGFTQAGKSVRLLRRRVDQAQHRFARSFRTMGSAAQRFGRLGIAIGGASIATGLAVSARNALKFNERMAEVNTIAGLSNDQLGALGIRALELSRQLGQGTSETTKGLYDALSSGVPAGNVIEYLGVAGRAAISGVTSIDVAVDGLTSAMNAYGLQAGEAGRVSDLFFNIVKEGKITFPELSKNIGKVAPIANAAGLELTDLGGALASMVRVEKPERAMTNLAAAIRESAKAGVPFLDWVRKFRGQNLEQIMAAGVTETAASAITILAGNYEGFVQQIEKARHSAGMTESAFATMAATPAFQIKQLGATLETLSVSLGNSFLPLVNAATQAMLGMFGSLDGAEGEQKVLGFATTAILTITGFAANFVSSMNTAIAYIKGAFAALSGYVTAMAAGFQIAFGAAFGGIIVVAEKAINTIIAGLNKLPKVNIQPVQFEIGHGILDMARDAAEKQRAAMGNIMGDALGTELAAAQAKNEKVAAFREQIEGRITKQAEAQTTQIALAEAQRRKAANAAEEEAMWAKFSTNEATKQAAAKRVGMAAQFAAAVTQGSVEAYRAERAGSEARSAQEKTAKNTGESNKLLASIDGAVNRFVGMAPVPVELTG